MKVLFILFLLFSFLFFAQDKAINYSDLDSELLNEFILEEVNALRKKAKVKPLVNETLLKPAANDHSGYMLNNRVLTHYQKGKVKKGPKNRVDYYGGQFKAVGENVQLTHVQSKVKVKRKDKKVETYSELAKSLVYNWEHSPPHYKNIITPDYKTTYTAVRVGENGEIYACQLFGSNAYQKPKEVKSEHEYDVYNQKKCKRCLNKSLKLGVHIAEGSSIYMYAEKKKDVKKVFRNGRKDGVVADIVLRNQFECGQENQYNGRSGVTGFLLPPVFKKDFNSDSNFYRKKAVWVKLGKVPAWVDQDYEVNLTLINKNRTCQNIIFYQFRTEMNLDLNIGLDLDSLSPSFMVTTEDSLIETVRYDKGKITISDSNLLAIKIHLEDNKAAINKIRVEGFSSIEGTTELNKKLYTKRANNLLEPFRSLLEDSSKVEVTAKENFRAFRKDIKGTDFAYLIPLDDIQIKEKLKDTALVNALEPFLKEHRYSKMVINYKWKSASTYDVNELKLSLQNAVDNKRIAEAIQIQKMLYWYFLKGNLTLDDIGFSIPFNKENLELLLNNSILKFNLDTLNPDSYLNLEDEFKQLLTLDLKNKQINTFLAVFDFVKLLNIPMNNSVELFKSIKKRKYLEPKLKARLLIAIAYYNDVVLYGSKNKNVLLSELKKYIKPAKLLPNEQFDVARYYSFYFDDKTAYELTRKILGKTEDLNNWVYFLKLIHMSEIKDKRKLYLKYFKKVQRYAGKDFCKLFHSPMLNFQILEDEEIKAIYCKSCK